MKKLPISVQTFEKIIEDDFLYIDKTQYLYHLIQKGRIYFLSRPRRFGKSLTISTLEAIFKNKKELFKGLWIYSSDYAWKKYPVIRLDISNVARDSATHLTNDLKMRLASIAQQYDILLDEKESLETLFVTLIETLHKKFSQHVVILIDEYDKPILDNILKKDVVLPIRDVLRSFYGIMKAQDANIKFVFVTGVTKFARISIFSDFNNLNDITLDKEYATMLGYTETELLTYFKEYIERFAHIEHRTPHALVNDIREWYNGFRFSRAEGTVYNPFSTLLLFEKQEFRYHWFETGTPTLVIDLIAEQKYNISEVEEHSIGSLPLSKFEISDVIPIVPLMHQTGYLTIKDAYRADGSLEYQYRLGYPNKEVEVAFNTSLVTRFSHHSEESIHNDLREMLAALYREDINEFFTTFKLFLSDMPYTIKAKDEEKYYQGLLYTVLRCLGIEVQVEVTTNIGRIDAVVELGDRVYLMEFKLRGTAANALRQITNKKYYEKYIPKRKKIMLVGVVIDKKNRTIHQWKAKALRTMSHKPHKKN